MLSENAEKILEIVLRECGNGYKILTDEDFSSVPDYADIISELNAAGYLSLRYSDENQYLIAPCYKARVYYEDKQRDYFFRAVVCKKAALTAFWGAFAGGTAVVLLFYLAKAVFG